MSIFYSPETREAVNITTEPSDQDIWDALPTHAKQAGSTQEMTVSLIRHGVKEGYRQATEVYLRASQIATWRTGGIPETINREKALEDCLREARRLGNQTVRDSKEVERWHKWADSLLVGPSDDFSERFDAPDRVEHRKFVRSLF